MPYEIRQKGERWYVVDTANNDKIKGSYDNEDAAEDRKDDLEFREYTRSRLDRIPVAEMTTEEKAAAWDKAQNEKNNEPPDDKNLPPKKEKEEKVEPPKKRSAYWGDMLDD